MGINRNNIKITQCKDKKEALKKMFQEQDREKLPAVFYTEILAKVRILKKNM